MRAPSPFLPRRRLALASALAAAAALALAAPEAVRLGYEPAPAATTGGLTARALGALRPGMTGAEKAEALARWVVANTTNDPRRKVPGEALPLVGLCGPRSVLFCSIARAAGLRAQRVNLYDFPRPGAGHSCVQAFWDGGWHFIDVTYAGYFTRGGRVLSLDEVRADPEAALAGLVVFEGDLDRDGEGRPVDNRVRMHAVYTPDSIRGIGATGVPGSEVEVPLAISWDLARRPRALRAASAAELDRLGAESGITHQLGSLLGAGPQRFAPRFELDGAEAGRALALRLSFARASRAGIVLATTAEGAAIESGRAMTTTAAMTALGRHAWEIVVRPEGTRFALALAPPPAGERLELVSVEWTERP